MAAIEQYYRFMDKEYLEIQTFVPAKYRVKEGHYVSEHTLQELVENLTKKGLVSSFYGSILTKLSDLLIKNHSGEVSDIALKDSVGLLVRQFDTNNHLHPQAERKVIATLLAISMSSLDFWQKHSDLAEEPQLRIAPWVARDIAGGLIGGAIAIGYDYFYNGEIDWLGVGIRALIGAGVGSLGVQVALVYFIQTGKWL